MRDALAEVTETGWDSPGGRRLLASLRDACTTVTARAERGQRILRDPARRDELLSHAWELVEQHRGEMMRADNPWGYLTTCLRHIVVGLTIADTLQVSPTAVRNGTATRLGTQPPVRIGTALLDNDDLWSAGPADPYPSEREGWDSGLLALHAELVGRGAHSTTTVAAINRIADIATSNRRGHRETATANDIALRRLGLTPAQARALLALLIGSRTDGGQSSLWLRHRAGGAPGLGAVGATIDRRVAAYVTPFNADINARAA